ncbi:MAG: aminodeoxychorismate synthase component I [Chthoniobacterales bacterium]
MSSRGAGKSAGNSVGRILSGASRGGVILDGPAFGTPGLIAEEPDRIVEGSWDDWCILEEEFAAGKNAAVTDGGLAGWIDYEGNFRFGVFPQWRREPIDWPEAETAASAQFRSGMSEAEWVERVQRVHEYIAAGDIYQVNLTHNLCTPWDSSPGEFYPRFRGAHPAPCSAYLSLGDTTVLSASPEVFLDMSEGRIVTKPIKGTRARGADRLSDEAALRDLIGSAKERAELVMITDLLRNDLGQVCRYGSVHVPVLCQPETFSHVHHLVSTVEGSMRPEVSPIVALRACFPGGSITGAPKKRAMEIIAELEKGPRGIYTGAIGFIDWTGRAVFSIAIRTLVIREGIATYGVGAGIVADSDPQREYEETMHKAAGLFAALAD